jgi:CheY-like chemotaxis protein
MALAATNPESVVYQDLLNIHQSAERSAELTHQLLAFSRKQVIQPRAANLNDVIRKQEKILRRLMGEEIRLRLSLGDQLWQAFIDPSQVDQILTNLLVNARDSIDGTGTITITTGNVHLSSDQARDDLPLDEGAFVLLSVQDTGRGIAADTLEHIFEPFFTTKGLGEGTGLGLATVYGIVKQNRGYIDVESEPGQGTTFIVYLPRHESELTEGEMEESQALPGSETILVVEDEALVAELARRFLESQGYRVLLAGTPGEALAQVRAMHGPIHLLLTDVVLPEMNGKELQKSVKTLLPEVKVLYMSGYSSDLIAERGVLEEGVNFIEKPFSTAALGRRIREILDGG